MISALYLACTIGLSPADCNTNTAIDSVPVEMLPGAGGTCVSALITTQMAAAKDPRNVGKPSVYYKLQCRHQ